MATKRSATALVASSEEGEDKRARTDGALVAADAPGALVTSGPARTSELLAPIMLLTGHGGPVFTAKFSPDGNTVLSAGQDRLLLLWNVFGECENTMNYKGHTNAVLEVTWAADGEHAFSASADQTGALWDIVTGGRVRVFKGHSGVVNAISNARDTTTCATASDDRSARIWDARVRRCQQVLPHPWPVTAVATSADGMSVYTGCLDGHIRTYDLRRPETVQYELAAHTDLITGLRLNDDSTHLLSNGMDNMVRSWDVKPYASGDRSVSNYLGAMHNFEKTLIKCAWAKGGTQVGCGSADSLVYVWDAASSRIKYKLPGHAGAVNEVAFHPTQPILCSCGNDKQIYLGEVKAHTN